jgi:membrane peptidoglycan carboxypeptidase
MQRYAPTPRQMLWGVLGAFVLMLLFVGVGYATTSIPSPNSIATRQATLLYYSDGKHVLARLGDTNRTNVKLSQVPVDVQHAVLSAEDRNFETEPGISPTGIMRAMFVDLKGGEVQGGSTITQQYVKNAYLTQARTFTRKFKEIFIAVKLGNTKPKDEILTDYLNTIYFGRNAYGIQAASKAYFNKDVNKLDVAQGAVLAAIIRAPSFYDPTANHGPAVQRWHYVIDGMVKKGWLSADKGASLQYPNVLKTTNKGVHNSDCVGPKFFICQAVKAELTKNGFDEARQAAGGYKVITTIDKAAQDAAVAAVKAHNGNYNGDGVDKGRESALVTVQPGDGAIRAMDGGGDGCQTPSRKDSCTDLTGVTGLYNPAADYRRSPGSSFKPYTLIAALQQGISLDSRFPGPSHIDFPGTNGKGISNSEGESCGSCTLTQALAQSINTIFVPLAQKVGPDKVAQVAKDAGIPAQRIRPEDETPALTLGTAAVAPVDQAVGYATVAAQGVYAKPYLVASVKTSDGHSVFKAKKDTKRVFQSDVMADTTYAMTQVLTNGTAAGKELNGRPAAGKTGTNGERSGDKDAWFVGFTPQLSTAVWYGNADPQKFVTDNGAPLYGGGLPALTWQQMMNGALQGKPVESFPPAAHVGHAINPSPSSSSSSTSSPSPSKSDTPTPTPTLTTPVTPTVIPTHTPPGHSPPPSPAPSQSSTAAAGSWPNSTSPPGA